MFGINFPKLLSYGSYEFDMSEFNLDQNEIKNIHKDTDLNTESKVVNVSGFTNINKSSEIQTLSTTQTEVLIEVRGDLFSCAPSTSSLAHCISADRAMGKGIATLFKSKFGGLDELQTQNKQVGECAILERESRFIYYLITKEKYWQKPTYKTLQDSLEAMRVHAVKHKVSLISMPAIGCGLDRLVWSNVKSLLISVFQNTNIQLVIYKL